MISKFKLLLWPIAVFLIMMAFTTTNFENYQNCHPVNISHSLNKEKNEKLKIKLDCKINDFNLKILNKWGEVLFEDTIYKKEYDLNLNKNEKFKKGEFYIVHIKYKVGDKAHTYSGKFIII